MNMPTKSRDHKVGVIIIEQNTADNTCKMKVSTLGSDHCVDIANIHSTCTKALGSHVFPYISTLFKNHKVLISCEDILQFMLPLKYASYISWARLNSPI